MRIQRLIAAISLTAGLATVACAQPSQDQPPPGYGGQNQGGPPPGYGGGQPGYGAPPPGYQGPPPGDMSGPPGGPQGVMSGPGGAPPHGPRARFEAANVTHDGRLTLQQAEAANWPAVAKHFAEIDRDNKGYITMQDLHAWNMARHAARAGGMQGGPPPGGGMQAPPPSMQGPPPGQQY